MHPSVEDTLRAREVYKFYQPYNLTESLANSHSPSNQATEFATSRLLLDTALTAFAQLIALRFDAQRAIISLTDHEYEYFLAESTSTMSHLSSECYAQNKFLSRSGSRVPRDASICGQTLHMASYQGMGTYPAAVVPDLTLDGKLNQLECVKGAPYLRFYCGIALTSIRGVAIGSVYVVDDAARMGASLDQLQFLTMMAGTVMNYLENIRIKEEASRVTRMSQGLHAFIEGAGTMYGDWKRLRRHNLPAGAGIGYSWISSGVAVADGVTSTDGEVVSERELVPIVDSYFPHQPESSQGSSYDALTRLLRNTFSRAANLVREGMEVDGAVFFDAPVGLNQGRSAVEVNLRTLNGLLSESEGSSADEDYADVRTNPPSHPIHTPYTFMANNRQSGNHSVEEAAVESNVLGYSTRKQCSLNGATRDAGDGFSAIDQNLLMSLVRHYPEGKLFAFDNHGPISHPKKIGVFRKKMTVSMKHKRDRRKARKRAEIIDLLAIFPEARQVFFVPLYDSISQCFIGSFTWSTSDTRTFSTENDLSYLIAFGHNVMTEISRLNTLSADRAKDQFINNVSHELRSPLHGILASAEFLAETSMDGFQRSLVDNVDGCGRTLLDTIEHILDFSQVKKFGKENKQSKDNTAYVDISAIIEDVLEGVYAGFESHGFSSYTFSDTATNPGIDLSNIKEDNVGSIIADSGLQKDVPSIILDIDFREEWRFSTVPGTWRRLAMNVFGNALKYTSVGWIKVKLEARIVSPMDLIKNDGKERTIVIMTISDSGKGISSDFIKSKLFLPFSQEDVTTPGTGLGMSIVKQLIDVAGGTIDVRSDLGRGTQVKLSLPLENQLGPSADETVVPISPSLSSEDPISTIRRRAQGRTVSLQGFSTYSGATSLQSQSLASLKASIGKYIRDWFNLRVISHESGRDSYADIIIADESTLPNLPSITGNEQSIHGQIFLILCSSRALQSTYVNTMDSHRTIEFVSKPCGPRRLAKALLHCLDKANIHKFNAGKASVGDFEASTKKQKPNNSDSGIFFRTTRSGKGVITADKSIDIENPQSNESSSSLRMSLDVEPREDTNRERSSTNSSSPNNSSGSDIKQVSSTTTSSREKSSSGNTTPSLSPSGASKKISLDYSTSDLSVTEHQPLPRRKMLLVEDNPVNMMLLSTYMRKNNWDFESSENGLLALQSFENYPLGFDVIFMDVSMPIMTGYESTREIRKVELARRKRGGTNRPALIIALTGFSSQRDQEMAFESGVDIFMTKPVRFKEVGRILNSWIRGT